MNLIFVDYFFIMKEESRAYVNG